MNLHLIDISSELIASWKQYFAEHLEVHIQQGDILELAENTIVSPGNSYGFMCGGIDRLYTDFFGKHPQQEIQDKIRIRKEGMLPVGTAIVVRTGNPTVPYMIAAPTMIQPNEIVSPSNCFFTMAAVLSAYSLHSDIITDIFCPGLGTGGGQVPPDKAAKEMANAYGKWKSRQM
jgi:O-acetyl-ADP-ribose deacetylase (regulator of RNase III)